MEIQPALLSVVFRLGFVSSLGVAPHRVVCLPVSTSKHHLLGMDDSPTGGCSLLWFLTAQPSLSYRLLLQDGWLGGQGFGFNVFEGK